MITVAFLHENTLGHTSYLPRFAAELERRPELGIKPRLLSALPLPRRLARWGDSSIPWFRRHGLDFGAARWRYAASRHLQLQLENLQAREPVAAVIVNTQSVGLTLPNSPDLPPLLVCLDATFQELEASPWFAPTPFARTAHPLTMAWLRKAERRLFERAALLLPWSRHVAAALATNYGVAKEKIRQLPPSMTAPPKRPEAPSRTGSPQILFIGGNFERKGGPLLLRIHQERFADRAELHIVTFNQRPCGRNVYVHHGVQAGGAEWLARWREASVFVFPSELETFGIVLIEAQAFETPIIASRTGAAAEILDDGRAGILLDGLDGESLGNAIEASLAKPEVAADRARAGRRLFEERFELGKNAERLAGWIYNHTKTRRHEGGEEEIATG